MNSLPAIRRGVRAGMSTTFQNTSMVLSIGIFFSLMMHRSRPVPCRSALAAGLDRSWRLGSPGPAGRRPATGSRVLFASLLGLQPDRSRCSGTPRPCSSSRPADAAVPDRSLAYFPSAHLRAVPRRVWSSPSGSPSGLVPGRGGGLMAARWPLCARRRDDDDGRPEAPLAAEASPVRTAEASPVSGRDDHRGRSGDLAGRAAHRGQPVGVSPAQPCPADPARDHPVAARPPLPRSSQVPRGRLRPGDLADRLADVPRPSMSRLVRAA